MSDIQRLLVRTEQLEMQAERLRGELAELRRELRTLSPINGKHTDAFGVALSLATELGPDISSELEP